MKTIVAIFVLVCVAVAVYCAEMPEDGPVPAAVEFSGEDLLRARRQFGYGRRGGYGGYGGYGGGYGGYGGGYGGYGGGGYGGGGYGGYGGYGR